MQQLCFTCGNACVLESRGVYATRKARVSVHCTFSAIVCFSRFARSTEQAFLHMWLCTFSCDIRKASYVERMRDSLLNSKAAQRNGLEGRMRQPMALRTKTMMAGGLSNEEVHGTLAKLFDAKSDHSLLTHEDGHSYEIPCYDHPGNCEGCNADTRVAMLIQLRYE